MLGDGEPIVADLKFVLTRRNIVGCPSSKPVHQHYSFPSIHHSTPKATMASNMISTGNIWWMTPLQAFATLGAAINFGE